MTATVIQLRDYQNPKDLERLYAETTLEQQAIEIMNVALLGDTSPCEYVAPESDPA